MRTFTLTWLALLIAHAAGAQNLIVPNSPDLMVKTRQTGPNRAVESTEIIYLKGARQRRESIQRGMGPDPQSWIRITQCDEQRTLLLNEQARTYAYEPIESPAAFIERVRASAARQAKPASAPAADMKDLKPTRTQTVTIDTVDTGEVRPSGHYPARHVMITRTTDYGGSAIPSMKEQRDGWYIDVPASNCWGAGSFRLAVLSEEGTKVEIKQHGKPESGYPIEETERSDVHSRSMMSRIELVEISEAPLDDGLFTVPEGYRPALPNLYGSYDMTKPDTLANRLTQYREAVERWVDGWFRTPHGY